LLTFRKIHEQFHELISCYPCSMNYFNVEMVYFARLTTHSAAMMLNNYYLFYAPANDITALLFLFSSSEFILNVN